MCDGVCKRCTVACGVQEELSTRCCECKEVLPLKVLHSAAGFYLGHFCPNCGPYDRLSFGYYASEQEAYKALERKIAWAKKA